MTGMYEDRARAVICTVSKLCIILCSYRGTKVDTHHF